MGYVTVENAQKIVHQPGISLWVDASLHEKVNGIGGGVDDMIGVYTTEDWEDWDEREGRPVRVLNTRSHLMHSFDVLYQKVNDEE